MSGLLLEEKPGGLLAAFKVSAGASRTEVRGERAGAVRMAVAAPAEKNKANEALLAFLARRFGLPVTSFRILSGRTSPLKRIFCPVTKEVFLRVFGGG